MKNTKILVLFLSILVIPQYVLACIYCEADDPEITNPAKSDNPRAQYVLSYMYAVGRNVEKDDKKAFYWIKKSVDNGFPHSYHYLGIFYLEGRGVQKDIEKGIEWLEKSASAFRGGISAKTLSEIYSNDKHIPKDLVQAYKWIKVYSKNGETNDLSILESQMTLEEITEAEAKAMVWLLKVKDNPMPKALF